MLLRRYYTQDYQKSTYNSIIISTLFGEIKNKRDWFLWSLLRPRKFGHFSGLKWIQYFHTKDIFIPIEYNVYWNYGYWNSIMTVLMTSLSKVFKQNLDMEASNTKSRPTQYGIFRQKAFCLLQLTISESFSRKDYIFQELWPINFRMGFL